jgi:predicted RNA binding protein YcfA (HicA-like mRNA interferase family)
LLTIEPLTASELKRKLAKAGCAFEQGSKHLVIFHGDKRAIMPRHPGVEIRTGTYHAILKQLGIKESEL